MVCAFEALMPLNTLDVPRRRALCRHLCRGSDDGEGQFLAIQGLAEERPRVVPLVIP